MKLELIDNHYLKNQTSRESVKGFSTPFIPIDTVTLSDMFLSSPHCERVKSSITPLQKKKYLLKVNTGWKTPFTLKMAALRNAKSCSLA